MHCGRSRGSGLVDRPTFAARSLRLVNPDVRALAVAAVNNAPIDPKRPIEVVLREEKKTRAPDANAAMWAGPLRDIAQQAWVDGRQFTAEVWHEWYKRTYLPEDDDPELEMLVRDGYRKWAIDPSGARVLIGSTTQLTVRGMARYMQQIEAHGASLGVQFHVAPDRVSRRA